MGEHMVSHGKIKTHVLICKKPTWEYLYLAEFSFRPHPNSVNSPLKIRATTTAQLQQQQHHPKRLLDTQSEKHCIGSRIYTPITKKTKSLWVCCTIGQSERRSCFTINGSAPRQHDEGCQGHFPFDMEAVRRYEANRHLALSHPCQSRSRRCTW